MPSKTWIWLHHVSSYEVFRENTPSACCRSGSLSEPTVVHQLDLPCSIPTQTQTVVLALAADAALLWSIARRASRLYLSAPVVWTQAATGADMYKAIIIKTSHQKQYEL